MPRAYFANHAHLANFSNSSAKAICQDPIFDSENQNNRSNTKLILILIVPFAHTNANDNGTEAYIIY